MTNAQEIMVRLLQSKPETNAAGLYQRLRAMGMKGTQKQLATNANLLGLTLMDKGLSGDLRAIKMAFEMAQKGEAEISAEPAPTIVMDDN